MASHHYRSCKIWITSIISPYHVFLLIRTTHAPASDVYRFFQNITCSLPHGGGSTYQYKELNSRAITSIRLLQRRRSTLFHNIELERFSQILSRSRPSNFFFCMFWNRKQATSQVLYRKLVLLTAHLSN